MKKIISIILTLLIAISCSALAGTASAEEFTPSQDPVIYFEIPDSWKSFSRVFCYIKESNGRLLSQGNMSVTPLCTKTDTEGLYSYDISKLGTLQKDAMYIVYFINNGGLSTYPCYINTNCYGDTLYCDGQFYDNPYEAPGGEHKPALQVTFWRNQNKHTCGPLVQITDTKHIQGTALPPGETPYTFITDYITSGKLDIHLFEAPYTTADKVLRSFAKALGVSGDELADILTSIGYSTEDEIPPEQLILGDADLSGGTVTVSDATIIMKYLADIKVAINLKCADADENRIINIKDATIIQKFVAGLLPETGYGLGYRV